jgi:hypothetical protein
VEASPPFSSPRLFSKLRASECDILLFSRETTWYFIRLADVAGVSINADAAPPPFTSNAPGIECRTERVQDKSFLLRN